MNTTPAGSAPIDAPVMPLPAAAETVTRSFALRLAEDHPTTIEVAEYADGSFFVALVTRREGMEPATTAMRLTPKTFILLSMAMHKAAHNPEFWFAA